MKAIRSFPENIRRGIGGVLFDIDDTLTTEGRLTAAAYAAMERLHDAGLLTVPITGRPAGWCDHIARMWPVDAVVGENGAFYYRYDHTRRVMHKRYARSDAARAADRKRLDALATQILSQVPGSRLASDQACREADLAIDYCEDVAELPAGDVERIVHIFETAGARAKVSSIHINGWFGDYDKLHTAKLLLRECFDIDLDTAADRFVFVGDSPNDEPMFRYFPYAVGVANVRRFAAAMTDRPAYITKSAAGHGFTELVGTLLESV